MSTPPSPLDLAAPQHPDGQTPLRLETMDVVGLLTLFAVATYDMVNPMPWAVSRWLLLGLHGLFVGLIAGGAVLEHRRTTTVDTGTVDTGTAYTGTAHTGAGATGGWRAINLACNGHIRLAAQVALMGVMAWAGSNPTTLVILFFVLSVMAQELLGDRSAYIWIGAFGLLTAIGFVWVNQNWVQGSFIGLGALGGYLFIGDAARNRRAAEAARAESLRLLQELRTAHAQLQQYAHEAEILAAAEERNRLARELHDTLGHRLTVAAVQLEGAQRLMGREDAKARQMVETVRSQVLDGLTDLRQTVATLRTPLEADLPLSTALQRLAEQFSDATGLEVHLEIDPAAQPALAALDRATHHMLYRTAQEGLTNAQKHAQASTLWVQVGLASDCLRLAVHDDGNGPPAQGGILREPSSDSGFGLRGLAERAEEAGGRVRLTASPHGGAALYIEVPLAHEFARSSG